jgi:hypothetical protein
MDGGIKFDVSANTAKFDADMARVGNVATRTSDKVRQAFSGIGGLLAGGAILGGLKTVMDDFDKVAKVATRFGASAEDIQRVGVAADLAGVSIDTVARVLTKMSVAASEASNGNEAMAEAFKRAGINAEQFKNAGLEEQLIMLSEAFNRARGNADATNQVIQLMGTRAAGQMIPLIDNTAALREEMAGVSTASDETVRRIEAANDRLTRFFNDIKVGAANAIGFITDTAERWGSLFGGAGMKTIAELDEIELRANAIHQLTVEGLLGGNDAENARLIAERMEEIQNRLKGNKDLTGLINEDLDTANDLEKEKTSELERQQRLLEQQESKRKEAIKDAQFEVELIEAKLRGDKARVNALEEQRDFERALKDTDSFETAANVAAAKSAERAAQDAERSPATSGGGGSSPSDQSAQSALDALRKAAETDARARADLFRIEAEMSRRTSRVPELMDRGQFGFAANTQLRAERDAEKRAQDIMSRRSATDLLFGEDSPLKNMGELTNKFRETMRKEGFLGLTEQDLKNYTRVMRDQSKTQAERVRESTQGGGTGGKDAKPQADPMSDMASDIAQIKEVLVRADGIHDRLPIRALSAA